MDAFVVRSERSRSGERGAWAGGRAVRQAFRMEFLRSGAQGRRSLSCRADAFVQLRLPPHRMQQAKQRHHPRDAA